MQTKPIRGATGADITENTLRITLKDLNIGKEIRDLSYVEKRLIMVISLTKQLEEAEGDLARTIESPANQLKVLSQQLERLRIALGNILNIFLSEMLPTLNGFIMALVEIINMLAEALKLAVGFKDLEYDYSGITGVDDSVSDLIDGMEEANDEAEKLKKNILGIDELNILEPNKGDTLTSGIDPRILAAFTAALEDWDNRMDEVNMKAYAIRDAILSWFGLEPTEDGWGLKEGASMARALKETIESINVESLTKELSAIVGLLSGAFLLFLAWKALTNPFLWIIVGLYEIWKAINSELADGETILRKVGDVMLGLALITAGIAILLRSWGLLGIAAIFLGIRETMIGLNDAFKDGVKNWEDMRKILNGVAIILGAFGILTGNWILVAIAGILAISSWALNELEGFDDRLRNKTTTFLDWIAIGISGIFAGILFVAETVLKALLNTIVHTIDSVGDAIFFVAKVFVTTLETMLLPIVNTLKGIVSIYDKIKGTDLSSEIQAYLITDKVKEANDEWDEYMSKMYSAVNGVSIYEDYYNSVLDSMRTKEGSGGNQNGISNASTMEAISELMKKYNTVSQEESDVLNSVAQINEDELYVAKSIQGSTQRIYEKMSKLTNASIGGSTSVHSPIPMYANGGYPNKGMFLMNEGSSAEMIGTINGRTAVANNEQIAGALASALAPLLGTVVTAVENVAGSERPIILYADSREIARASQSGSKKLGYNQIGGEFANV